MKTSLSLLLTGIGLLVSPMLFAQGAWQVTGDPGTSAFHNSVGITVGTQGIGAEVDMPLSSRFNLRLGTSLLPYKGDVVKKFNSSNDYNTDFKVEFMNFGGYIDWQLFPDASAFFNKLALSVGGAYFYKAGGNATVKLADSYFVGDIEFTPDEVGEVRANVDWKGWAPYAGIGWHNITIANNFDLGVNLGTYYIGSPDVKMTATNWLEPNAGINEPILTRNLKDYKWLPKLEIKFTFKY